MATIATEAAPIYSESGRGEKKRLQLKKKLDERRKKKQGASVSQEVTAAAAKQAATIARNAAEHIKAQQTEDSKEDAPRAKVKIGGKSLVTTELELKPSEKARIQAKCAAGQ